MEKHSPPSGTEAPKRKRSALVYLLILALAAFLLLLLAYFMQQRSSEEIIGNLNELRESMSSIQSVDELLEDNRRLREENAALREQLGEAQGQLVDAQGNLSQEQQRAEQAEEQLIEQTNALLLLEQLEHLCETGQLHGLPAPYDRIEWMEAPLAQLDQEKSGSYPEGWPTLTERYQAVIEAIAAEAEE